MYNERARKKMECTYFKVRKSIWRWNVFKGHLIGVQELNFGVKRYDRDEKINVLHVAICKLLSNYGYYKFDSIDKDGWPHYIEIKALENLSEIEQQNLIKKAIINYLN